MATGAMSQEVRRTIAVAADLDLVRLDRSAVYPSRVQNGVCLFCHCAADASAAAGAVAAAAAAAGAGGGRAVLAAALRCGPDRPRRGCQLVLHLQLPLAFGTPGKGGKGARCATEADIKLCSQYTVLPSFCLCLMNVRVPPCV